MFGASFFGVSSPVFEAPAVGRSLAQLRVAIPPGTRTSLFANPEYAKVSFAKMTLDSIKAADPLHPSVKPTPYVDVLFPAIPEYLDWGTKAG